MSLDIDKLWRKAKPDDRALVPCVVQDVRSRAVLMVAWVSKEALAHTLETGWATYWSRSRGELWEKGATSGNRQRLVEVRLDCDGDTLMYVVEPEGPACHHGFDTCFWRRRVGEGWRQQAEHVLGDAAAGIGAFDPLGRAIAADESSVEAGADHADRELFTGGIPEQTRAFREHAEKLARALGVERKDQVREEAADLLYVLAVALRTRKLDLDDVLETILGRAHGEP